MTWYFKSNINSDTLHLDKSTQAPTSAPGGCSEGEFKCDTTDECYENSWKCDDITDCTDGSDEQNCGDDDGSG